MFPTGLFSLFCFVYLTAPAVGLKSWIPNTSINDKRNWNVMDLPRNCDEISFKIVNDLTVSWSLQDLIVTGLRLPASGTLTFKNDMSIGFKDKARCPGGRLMKYMRDEWKGWLDPFNWESDSDGMWLPHAKRIPCSGEDVKFPPGKDFAVQLPEIKVPIGKIHFDDEEFDGDDWSEFLNTERGKSMFRSEEIIQEPWLHEKSCPAKQKCDCGKSPYVFENRRYKFVPTAVLHQAICLYARPKCQISGCYSPVFPEGHCCGICGAIIKIQDTTGDDRLLNKATDIVKKLLMDSEKAVQYYVGKDELGMDVVISSEDPNYASYALSKAALIHRSLSGEKFPIVSVKFSDEPQEGIPLDQSATIILGTFLGVLLFFIITYLVYEILPKNIKTMGKRLGGFVKFTNAFHGADSEEQIEINPEAPICEFPKSFQNPTYTTINEGRVAIMNRKKIQGRDPGAGQEYDNPTYHVMEKREHHDGKPAEQEIENIHEFTEIHL